MKSHEAAAEHIGDVVGLISEIASQTNLLALNAIIEAARGCAVVAGKVKALAQQSARATDDIREQVMAIHGATQTTAGDIRRIATTIQQVTSVLAAVAAAVEEQNATTAEISRSVRQVALGMQRMIENTSTDDDAADAGRVAEAVANAVEMLQESYVNLEGAVVRSLEALRRDQAA